MIIIPAWNFQKISTNSIAIIVEKLNFEQNITRILIKNTLVILKGMWKCSKALYCRDLYGMHIIVPDRNSRINTWKSINENVPDNLNT